MIRALRLLALFTALFVVSVRGSSAVSWPTVCAILPDSAQVLVCPLSDEPDEQDTLAIVGMDDSDDGADVVIAPSEPRIRLLSGAEHSAADCAALAADRALSSHARGLDRPPRA